VTAVLYTGGSGRMGSVIRAGLAGAFDRTVLYVRTDVPEIFPGEEVVKGGLDDLLLLAEACRDVDVVIHLAGIADEAPWTDLLKSNIEGTYAVLEAARRAGVRRVVYASSNHIIGCYPTTERIGPNDPVRPDTYYGVSKVFGEGLARLYHDKWGLEVICLRIGSFRPRPEDVRQLSTWLSHRDGVELVRRAVLADPLDFQIVYGVSANARSWWDNDAAADAIGYQPRDDAEDFAIEVENTSEPRLQGGAFTHPDYQGGLW